MAITYGTALSGTQLDASASVAGTYSYSPPLGTVLHAGVQTLSVTFTPTDTTDYTTATGTVNLTVNKAVLTVTADNKSRMYGAANPSLSYIFSGFVSGDTSSVVSGVPSLSTTATSTSVPGVYAISIAANTLTANDYNFSVVSGTLTITAPLPGDADLSGTVNGKDLDIVLSNYNKTFDITGNPYAAWSYGDFNQDGIVNGKDLDILLSNYNKSVAVSAAGVTSPGVTINQASGQTDPTNASPIHFTVVFSEKVTDFATGDVSLGGTAPGTLVGTVTAVGSDGTTYDVAVSGMTGSGTVVATIPAGKVHDAAGNPNTASTSADNSVQFTMAPPLFALTAPVGGTYSAGQDVTFQWIVENARANSTISLCYDEDQVWSNGNEHWIEVGQIAAANGQGSYTWNTANVPAGTYYVAGDMSDGAGTCIYSYRTEPITIRQAVAGQATVPGTKIGTVPALAASQVLGGQSHFRQTKIGTVPRGPTC